MRAGQLGAQRGAGTKQSSQRRQGRPYATEPACAPAAGSSRLFFHPASMPTAARPPAPRHCLRQGCCHCLSAGQRAPPAGQSVQRHASGHAPAAGDDAAGEGGGKCGQPHARCICAPALPWVTAAALMHEAVFRRWPQRGRPAHLQAQAPGQAVRAGQHAVEAPPQLQPPHCADAHCCAKGAGRVVNSLLEGSRGRQVLTLNAERCEAMLRRAWPDLRLVRALALPPLQRGINCRQPMPTAAARPVSSPCRAHQQVVPIQPNQAVQRSHWPLQRRRSQLMEASLRVGRGRRRCTTSSSCDSSAASLAGECSRSKAPGDEAAPQPRVV